MLIGMYLWGLICIFFGILLLGTTSNSMMIIFIFGTPIVGTLIYLFPESRLNLLYL